MTRPGPLGRRRAPSSSSTSSSSTMASGGIRRSGISAPGPSSDGWITKHRQLNPGVYEIGASPQGLLEAFHRLGQLALLSEHHAPVVVSFGIVGLDAQGLLVVFDRLDRLALGKEGRAPVAVGFGEVRL